MSKSNADLIQNFNDKYGEYLEMLEEECRDNARIGILVRLLNEEKKLKEFYKDQAYAQR